MNAVQISGRTVRKIVLTLLILRSAWSYPLIQPIVIIFPPQNLMPFQMPSIPLTRQAANGLIKTYVHPSTEPIEDLPKLEHNGHQNPSNIIYENKNIKGKDQDYDSISVEAANPSSDYVHFLNEYPDGRFSIGGIISGIPFLPIEVNVPDSIAWIYNGISGIIGGIGQRIPFINRVPNEPRPYSSMNPMSGQPLFTPVRIVQIPMEVFNVQRPLLYR